MKKHLLFLFTALSLLLVPAAMKAQTTVTIGDETSTSTYYYLPVNTFYNYSLSQQIYTADEINMPNGGTITSISFDYAYTEAFSMSGVQVYMKNVSKSTFDSITDMVEVGYEDKVFEGTFSASGAGWVTLTLNTPFHYDGTSNLLVCLYDPTSGYPGSSYKFRTTLTPSGQALALTWYSDSEIPDIEDLSSNYSGNKGTRNYRTNIKMTINPDITEINVTGFSEPAWGAHPDYTWEVPSGANYYIQTTDSKWQDLTTSSNLFAGNVFNQEGHEYALTFYFKCIYGYHFSNNVIVKINNYAYLVKNKYTDNIGYYAQTVSFTVEPDVYVGEGGVTTINAPYNSNWAYSVVEQVYTADEIGVPDGGEISAIKFKMYSSTEQTNHITVYMKHVSRSEFASTSDYEEITTSDIVYEGDYTFTQGWNTIPLAVPFNYNGTDNLMVAIHENTSGYTPRYFYGTSKTNSVLSYHSDYDDIDPYDLASWTSGKYLKSERAVIKLVIPATTVNDGSATNNYVPVYGFYADAFLKAEFVIPASSLTSVPTSRDLTSMTFYATQSNVFWGNANFKVFLKEVAGTTISDFTGYDDATIVYEGEDLYIMDGKMTVPFTTPYTYNGGNLLVGVYNTVEGTYVTSTWLGVNATGASVQGYSYSSLDEVTATQRDFLPKTTFTFTNKMEPTAQIGEGTGTNNYLPTYTLYDYSLSEQIYTGAEIGRSGDIYTLAFYNTGNVKTRDIDIYMVNTNKSSFSDSHDWTAVSSSDLVFSGEVSFLSNEWTTIELTHPFSYSSANNLLIVVDDNTGDWNGSVPFLVFDAPSQALYNYRDELDLDPSSPNYFGTVYNVKNQIRLGFEPIPCHKPTNLTVSNIGKTSATLTWEAPSDSYEWSVQYSTTPDFSTFDGELAIDRTFNLSNLTPGTTYYVRVQSSCYGIGMSEWGSTVSFTTLEACAAPTGLAISNIGNHSATISWTENDEATAWQICLDGNESSPIDVTENPYTLDGLTPNTTYSVKVRANCGGSYGVSDWSYEESFTTLEPCPAPFDLSVTGLTFNSADIEWTGFGEEYTVNYRPLSIAFSDDFENGLGQWTTVDNDGDGHNWFDISTIGSIYSYYSSLDLTSWASHGSNAALSGSYINDVGALSPDNWLITPQVSLDGMLSFRAKGTDGGYYQEHFAVYVSTTGTDPADFTQVSEEFVANYDYTNYMVDLSSFNGQQGYVAIRHFNVTDQYILAVDDFVIYDDSEPWQTTTSTSESIYLSGLTSSTDYQVMVQSNCGSDGISGWSEILTFHTPEEVTVFDGSANNSYIPVQGFYADAYLKAEYIMNASELTTMSYSDITEMTFYAQQSNISWENANFKVFMKEVPYTTLSDYTGYSDAVVVYEGPLSIVNGKMIVHFTTPYHYTGDHLLVGVYNTAIGDYHSCTWKGTNVSGASVQGYNYSSLDNVPAYQRDFVPKTTFEYVPGAVPSCLKPVDLAVNNITYSGAELSWNETGTATDWVIEYGTAIDFSGASTVNATTIPTYLLSGLTETTTYYVHVKADCGGGDESSWSYTFSFTTPEKCPTPSNLAISNIGKTSATLNWTENGTATEWQVCVNGDEAGAITVTTTPYTLTGLTTETEYTVKVRANCGGGDGVSAWSAIQTFTTLTACFAPTNLTVSNVTQTSATLEWTENDAATEWQICVNGDEANPITVTTNPYTLDGLTPNTIYSVKVRANCGGSNGVSAWTGSQTFTTISDYVVQSTGNWYGYVYNGGGAWNNKFVNFSMSNPSAVAEATVSEFPSTWSAAYAKGYVWFITEGGDLCRATLNNSSKTISAYETIIPGFEGSYARPMAYNPANEKMYYMVKPADDAPTRQLKCFDPSNPNLVTEVGTIGFVAQVIAIDGTGQAYCIEYTTGDLYRVNLTDASHELIGSTGVSVSYPQSMAFDNNTGELFWAQYFSPSDNGLYVVNPFDASTDLIGHLGNFDDVRLTGLFMGDDFVITCPAPSDLSVSNVGPHTADFSWTGSAGSDQWECQYSTSADFSSSALSVTVNEPSAQLTGLTPETTYYVRVRTLCGTMGNSYWSNTESFTTEEACPVPSDLSASNITANSADVSWTGFGESYDLRYVPGNQLRYDNGIYENSWGYSSGATVTWATMYPASMLGSNSTLTDVSIYEDAGYNTENITIEIYSGGDDAPGTLLYSEVVTPQGSTGFHEITLSSPVTFDPSQNLWISLTEYGTYVICSCDTNESELNCRWINDEGTWQDVSAMTGDYTICWMIRATIGNGDAWTTLSGITSPAHVSGLDPETTYMVQVQSDCGVDGTSGWSNSAFFTTTEPCPAPYDLAASDITGSSANLSWTGFGETYTVRYRQRSVFFSDDFENGLGQWTQIDADGDGNGWRLGSDLFTPNAHSGSDIVLSESYRNSYGALTPDNYLVTPQITLGGTVMFWVKAQDPSYPEEHFGIAVSTAGNTDATDFTTIAEWTMTAGDWQQYTVDLSAYAGQQGYVALRHFGCTDMYCLDIDDFVITGDPSSWTTVITTDASVVLDGLTPGTLYEVQVQSDCGSDGTSGWSEIFTFTTDATPPCPAPTDLIVSNTTKHTAELSWTENGTATEWQFAISSNGTDTIDILSNPWILDGLDPETEYLVKVRANCGSNVFSDWSNEVIFITEVGCQTPDNLTVVDATYSTATLNWTGEGENFTVEYEILGSGEWDTIEEILPPLTITGLQPGTDYEVHVMGNCDADGMSLWSNIVEFSTPLCPIPINLEVSNTTKHTADLNWMEIGTATEWQINLSDGIDNVIIPVTDIPSYTLTGLDAYTEYTVMVQSNCEGAWSGWGDMVIFITELGCLPTTDLAATDATNSSVTLTWTGEGETFHLQYRPASGDWETIDNVTSPYVLDGLLSGTDYEVQVMNDCGADGVSDWSNSVTFTTLLCPIPTDIEVTNVGKHTATVSWTENGSATEWQILVTSDVFDTLTVTENPYTLIDLAAETEYTVKVRANCSGAWSDWSDMTIFTTPIGCQATSDLAWTAVSQNSATLTWTGEGETFILQYKADGEEWATIDDVTSPYTLTGLQSNTEYMVQVMNNCNADGVSAWSNMVTFTTSLCPTPSNLSATNVDKHTATLGWTETGEATEWQIMFVSSDTNIIDVTANPYTLNELADGTEYTAKVRANCGGSWSNWCEQVTFTTLIGCPATDNLAVTAFTQTTATLEWTGEGATFNMQYRTPGGEWTTINSVTSPYILSGLTPSTSYEAQIQNDCGLEGTSEWSNLATFTTSACDPQAIPYAYDFEAEDPFYCWSVVTGNVQRLHALPSQNHTTDGEYSLAFNESASDVIAFPQFTQEVNTLQVSFWVRPHNNTMSGNGTFAVGYLTDVNDASTFTAVSTYSYDEWPGTYEFMRKIVTLQDAPAGATIAFRHDSPTADGSWYVDDILVSAICNVPTGITVTNITNNSATVTWTDNGAGSWDVTRTNLENFAHNVTTNEYTFTELNPGTEYFIKVRSRCGDDIISNWSEVVSFTTLTNSIPTYVDITGDSIVCHLSTTLLTANTDVPATYLWSNGATTQQINVGAGTYQVTVTSATGDELASEPFVLTEIPSFATQESRSICPNELPYIWNGHTFTETGMEHVTLTAANGCDSIVTMILTVNPTYNDTIEVSTCEGEGYIFNGEYLYESGYYVDSLQTINGCDSVVVLSLTVNPIYAIKAVETICSSELPYEWNGVTFNEEGTQVAQFETVNGCDSLIVMTLYVNPSYSDTIVANICAGDAYNFYGQLLTSSGEYTHPMQTVDGCDSVEVLALTVNPTHSVTEERTVCSIALPYTWNGVLFTGPATKYATLHTASGCDSVVTMVLSVSNAFEITETRAVCASELPIVWNGKTFNEAGTQMDTLTASNGCDSIVTMVLTVNTPVNTVTTTESCGAFTWAANGETYTESDTYLYEHLDAHGCTQVDTLYLTIYNPVNTATTAESCGSYTWEANGQTYTESDTYLYEHLDVHGCTQVDTLYLTIYNPVNTASSVTACGAFTWAANGETYTESDTYLYEHLDAHGCTQVDTLYLTIYNPMNTATTAESCGAYTWEANGQTYTESNTYYYEHQDAHGCTQVDTLYLTINTPTNTAITEAACGSYTWAANGQTYTESGTYYYEHQDAHNCTQVDTLYLTINTPVNTATTAESCGSYTWAANGQTYTESNTYYYEHQDANGCTQVDTLYLTINNPVNTVTTDESCGSYTWAANGQTYYVSGEYTYSHQDANGCTQVDTLRLTILQGSSAVLTNIICASELPYEWNGVTFTEAGMQTTTIEAANGCDSVITMVLMVNTPVHHAYTAEACGSYTWVNGNNQTYTTSGDYTYSHQDINGCTQVDTLHLTIFTPAHNSITVAECGSYTWTGGTGVTYTESGDYLYSHQDANGCTQVDTLHLTIFTPIHTAITVAECGSYTWTGGNGQTYTESGNYTYSHQDAHGCTQVDTLHLTIYNPVHTAITAESCGSYTWEANNQTYAVSGDYTYSHQDYHGCTQVDTLHLTILQGSSAVLMNTICASELPYEWNGVTFTEAGMQTATITAANGCDSVVTMVLTINTPVNTAISASECGSYTWTANGQTYTASGDYTYSHLDANGCTQVDTLHLTIYNPVHTAVTVSECGDYTWNGQTYTASGDYTYSHLDVHGCTQVDTLHLTIHNPVHTAVTVSECSSYTWNGQTYTTSGDYTYSHLDANGCTQVDTLHLTIFTPAHSAITVTECGDYTWNGQTYTASGDYTYSHIDANGCTQVDTLHLTIHNPVHTAITVEECDSYTWTDGNNQNYTTSGTYTYEHQDANGCTQVDTLHLTIHQSATSEFTIATQDSCYTWNGQTYCASGDYVQTLETAFGCDSVVTLHLTTSVGVPVHEAEVVFLAPNPTKNISRIMGLETDPVSVDLYDMRGKLVMKASGRELDVTTLPTGLYMVKIYTGDRFINLKLVKQ